MPLMNQAFRGGLTRRTMLQTLFDERKLGEVAVVSSSDRKRSPAPISSQRSISTIPVCE